LSLKIFSKLSPGEIRQIFNEPKDIFPSDIGEETDFSQSTPSRHFTVAASCLPESRIKKEDAREPESSGIIMKKF